MKKKLFYTFLSCFFILQLKAESQSALNNQPIHLVSGLISQNLITNTLVGDNSYFITSRKSNSFDEEKTVNSPSSTGLIYGIVKDGTTPVSGAVVSLTLPWTDSAHHYVTLKATTNAQGMYSYTKEQLKGYRTITSLKLNNYENNKKVYFPTDVAPIPVPSVATEYNFNSQTVSPKKIYGTVKDGTTPISGAIVSLTLPWTDSAHGYVSLKATTNAQGEYLFTETQLEGYRTIASLKLNNYSENNNRIYFPRDIASIPVPSVATEYNFNSRTPKVTINQPSQSTVTIVSSGATVNLEALVGLTFDDGTTTISTVTFDVDETTIANNNVNGIYKGTWTPVTSDYGNEHSFKVIAVDSNGAIATKFFTFNLLCFGGNCPNNSPTITLKAPVKTTINQKGNFQNIPIEATITDLDGTISSVTITINGITKEITAGANNTYIYNFTPTSYQSYPMVITATDNEGGVKTLNETLKIINSVFVPLPSKNIILGYAHTWENTSAPFLYFDEIKKTKYNVVMYSFIETVGKNGYTPKLTINSNRYLTNGVYDSQLLKDDINKLRDQGIPVIVSIGGQNGHVELNTTAQKDEFVHGLKDIIDEYHFDGIDLDFENGSMNFGAGALKDFSYSNLAPYPKLKNVVDAFKELKQHYGSNFIMTCAPETFYVQTGYSAYSGIAGSFLPVIYNLRNELDLVMVQLYNTGSVSALDGETYDQAVPDFLTSMTDMLLTGFTVNSTGFKFPALPASKVMVGIPSCPGAAPAGGYVEPTKVKQALNYLRFGTDFTGRKYDLQSGLHPDLRGVMTWSINWDVAPGCASANEFSEAYTDYFTSTLSTADVNLESNDITVYPIPVKDIINIESKKPINKIQLFDIKGKKVFEQNHFENGLNVSFLNSGIYVLKIDVEGQIVFKKIIKN